MNAEPLDVFVTVGMGRWPFDRLLRAIEPVSIRHRVFAQSGTSELRLSYPHSSFLEREEFERRCREADVLITHAGNTVRVAQRIGKAPIVVAREQRRGEMGNDHQVRFLDAENGLTPMVVLGGDLEDLLVHVEKHREIERALLRSRTVPTPASPIRTASRLDTVDLGDPRRNPLAHMADSRPAWAWSQLAGLDGPHLDLGSGHGEFVMAMNDHTERFVVGCEPAADKLGDQCRRGLALAQIGHRDPLPFATGSFASVSLLDVLEHVWDEREVLDEVHRVLRPGGTVLLTVPRRHCLSMFDPDDVKFRLPRVHRVLYSLRYGRSRYQQRFVDDANAMVGDLARERPDHHNYTIDELLDRLDSAGFEVHTVDAANLLGRQTSVLSLLLPPAARPIMDALTRWDGRMFHQANLFVAGTRK